MVRLFPFSLFIVLICVAIFHTNVFADTLDFGRVKMNSLQIDTLLFKNEDMVKMMISKTTITDTAFSLPSHPFSGALSQLEPGEERYIPVAFAPKDSNWVSGDIIIETNVKAFHWSLTGEGVQEVIVINEILADPASGSAGDANGDGVRNSNEDEFVELLNTGKYPLEISGWQIFDAGASKTNRLTFPPDTWIGPKERVVVFGGGTPEGISGRYFVDDGRIGGGLRNAGDEILLFDPIKEDTLAYMAYGAEGNKNTSLVRWPEGTGAWHLHTEFPGLDDLFSPGIARTVVVEIEMVTPDTSVAFGDSLHLSAMKLLSDGVMELALDEDLNWHTSIENILVRENNGVWVGKQPGVVQLYSDFRGFLSDTISVRVLEPKMVRLDVSMGDSLLLIGNTYDILVAGVISEDEKTILTDGYLVSVSDSSIIRVVDGGIEALSLGNSDVTVTLDDFVARVTVQVVAYGDLNGDAEHTLWDAIRIIHLILDIGPQANAFELQAADLTQDGVLDIRDLIGVIQLMFGDEQVSQKLAKSDQSIGLRRITSGVSLDIPPQTIAITFKMKNGYQNKQIETSSGAIFFEQRDIDVEGIILPNQKIGLVWQSQTIQVVGESEFDAFDWMAWTLDGDGYLLMPQGEGGESLDILSASPNPINPSTTINYSVSVPQEITLRIYSVTGQWVYELFHGYTQDGLHKIVWNGHDAWGRSVASGLYFVHLKGEWRASTLKMVVLR